GDCGHVDRRNPLNRDFLFCFQHPIPSPSPNSASSRGPADDRGWPGIRRLAGFEPLHRIADRLRVLLGTDSSHTGACLARPEAILSPTNNPLSSQQRQRRDFPRHAGKKAATSDGSRPKAASSSRSALSNGRPVFTNRCCKLVSDQLPIRAGSTSRRQRLPRSWAIRVSHSRTSLARKRRYFTACLPLVHRSAVPRLL